MNFLVISLLKLLCSLECQQSNEIDNKDQTYRSLGSTQEVVFVLWSIKNLFPSKSISMSQPLGNGISSSPRLGIIFNPI